MLVNQAKIYRRCGKPVDAHVGIKSKVSAGGVFTIQCFDKDGVLKWEATKNNLVVNVGLKDMNDKYFSGSAYTAAWYIGLYGAGASNNPAAGDTMSSHAGWVEVTAYSPSNTSCGNIWCSYNSRPLSDYKCG